MALHSRLLAVALIGAFALAPAPLLAQTAKPPATAPAPAAKPGEPLDINKATKEQLMTLKGIGEARSDAIIKNRPYRAKNELVDKGIIPEAVYNDIKEQIIAHQVPATKPGTPATKK